MRMKLNSGELFVALAVFAAVFMSSGRLGAEFVFLKNGRIIEGNIVSESPYDMIVLERGGKRSTISRRNIMRVLYTQLYRGRLYIQKIDGSVIEAFIVDEDQEHYILRSALDSPREFSIRRDEVLFMTRKNPSALEGRVSLMHVDLTWKPPYTPDNPAKHYRVYIRTKGGEYKTAGETSGKSLRVRGLLCNTEYYSIVTAVDRNGQESLPSNEVHFTTKKGRPSPPGRAFITMVTSDAGRICTAHVSWDKAVDPCGGSITEYGVYLSEEKEKRDATADGSRARFPGYRLVARTPATQFRIPGLKDRRRYRVKVTSIDNTKDESDAGRTVVFNTVNKKPGYPFPVSCEKYVSSGGREIAVRLSWKDSDDPDGTVTGYRIYKKIKDTYDRIGSTNTAEYEVRGLLPAARHSFVVRAVDNRGDESEDSYPAATGFAPVTSGSRLFIKKHPIRSRHRREGDYHWGQQSLPALVQPCLRPVPRRGPTGRRGTEPPAGCKDKYDWSRLKHHFGAEATCYGSNHGNPATKAGAVRPPG